MLKMTKHRGEGTEVTLRLEGRLVGEWVDLVREEGSRILDRGLRLALDLSELRYIDRSGIDLLRRWRARGVLLVGTTPLVEQLIDGSSPDE